MVVLVSSLIFGDVGGQMGVDKADGRVVEVHADRNPALQAKNKQHRRSVLCMIYGQ